ncbi:MAG: ABC transporter permease [Acidimicrobiales bacterium]
MATPADPRAETALVARFVARDYLRRPGAWVTTVLTGALFALFAVAGAAVTDRVQERAEGISFRVAVEGDRDGAARFLDRLADPRLVLTPSEDAAGAVTSARASTGIVLPSGLDDRVAAGEPTELKIFYRGGNDNSQTARNTLALRLQAVEEGVLGDVVRAGDRPVPGNVALDELEVRRDERLNRIQTARALSALVCLLCLGVVSAVASLAGSGREQRSAEPLLVLPLRRSSLTTGLALGAFPLVSLQLFAAVAIVVGASALPLQGLSQPPGQVVAMLATGVVAAALLGLLASAAGGLAGVIGTGTDDAVSLGDFFAVPFVAVGVLVFLVPTLPMTPITSAVPILGPALALRDGVAGDLSLLDAIVATATTVAWFCALTALATRRVDDERRVLRALG